MIDLKKIKEHCKSQEGGCCNDKKFCKFFSSDSDRCLLHYVPDELDIEKIEEICNELFGGLNG
jgi:hypothetical protein